MSTTPEGPEARAETLTSMGVHHVGVCIDGSPVSERILSHGLAMARAFGATLTVLHVLEPQRPNDRPTSTDLLEWEIRRTDALRRLDGISAEYGSPELPVETELLEGRAAEEICGWVASHHVDLTVLCSHGRSGWTDWSLASTAKKLIEGLAGVTLLVPASALQEPPKREVIYERILVPLDASPRAESVLPVAAHLARVHDSELVLSHVVPVPELTAPVPLDEEELKLEQHLVGRNTRVAETYLALVSGRLAGQGLRARTVLADDDDVRFGLLRCISEERPDLVVLSGHGRSGRTDLPLGSIASFLLEHATAPVLIVREEADGGDSVIPKHRDSDSGRPPSLATT
jgi:nucleotide-binding universal stress UspA family protein